MEGAGEDLTGAQGPWKGRLLEDLVEYYFQLRGYHAIRNARVRGASGALHEVDLLLKTGRGPILVEVKNTLEPVGKEVVIKAFEVARDIGARGAVVVSASGFTRDAERMARSLGVDLVTMDEILEYIEASRALEGSIVLRARHTMEEADRHAARRARRLLFLITLERPERLGCLYAPFYYVEATFRVGERMPRYRDVDLVVSALTGLPIYRRGPTLAEGGASALRIPDDLAEAYRALAGRSLTWGEAVGEVGEAAWRRLLRALKPLGLVEAGGSRPRVYRVIDDRPPLGAAEEAAAAFLAPKAGGPEGCGVAEPRYSPGAAASVVERLYGASVRRVTTLHAPLAAYRMVGRGGLYRYLLLTLWTHKPLELAPADPVVYVEGLL